MGQRPNVLTPERSTRDKLGAEMRRFRREAGLSLADLAVKVNCHPGHLGRIERAERYPSSTMIEGCDAALDADGELIRLWQQAEAEGAEEETDEDRVVAPAAVVPPPRPRSLAVDEGTDYPASVTRAVSVLESLALGDKADSPALVAAGWDPVPVPKVITGYMYGGSAWSEAVSEASLSPAQVPPAAAAQTIRDTVRTLMALDFRHGGGHVRTMLLTYARHDIVPLLRQYHPDPVRRDLFSAAAEVAQLLAWSAYDSGRHGIAQRYFTQALRLTDEGGDRALGGRLLANMSHQANYLGDYGLAVQLARSAQDAGRGRATPTVQAMCMAMEARALASLGDSRGCAQALHRAEAEFARRVPGADPEWIAYFDEAELAGEGAHCARDLGHPREITEFAARALDPSTPPRTRAFINMVIAAGSLKAGQLDEALALAASAVEVAGPLQSARARRYITDFQEAAVARHGSNPSVRRFDELVAASWPLDAVTGSSSPVALR